MRDPAGFFVVAGQATDSSAVYAGAGRDLSGQFPDGRGATSRAFLPHTEKHQCRSMCTANLIKKSSMVSRDGALTKTMSLAGT